MICERHERQRHERCATCKKTSSVLLDCKCKNKYCTKHILPEIHNCFQIDEFRREAYERNKEKLLKESIPNNYMAIY